MKKIVSCVFAASLLVISCQQKEGKHAETSSIFGNDENEANGEIISHKMIDDKNQVMAEIPLPDNWKLHNEPGDAIITGPGGILVYGIPTRAYMFTNDPMMQQIYAQNGGKLRPYTSIEGIIQQDLLPIAQKEGSRFIKSEYAPDIAASDKSMSDMLYKVAPMDQRYEAAVTEWEDKEGKPYAIIVHLNGTNINGMISWSYNCHGLDAPKDRYDEAKKILVNGLSNILYNPQYFAEYNRREQQNAANSMAAHNQKMAANQQQFNAQQQAYQAKTDAINGAIMSSYNDRNAASDRSHNRFLNYIKEENTVYNPNDGNRYQVQSGSNHTWMNNNGEYINSNDPNYDPNRNQNTNNQNWNQVQTVD